MDVLTDHGPEIYVIDTNLSDFIDDKNIKRPAT